MEMKIIVKLSLGFGQRRDYVREVLENKILLSGCTPKEGETTLYLVFIVRLACVIALLC